MKLKKRLKKLIKSLVEKYQLKITRKSPKVIIMVNEHIIPKLPATANHTLVSGNNNDTGYLDLMRIIACKYQIASNLSFGFWRGLLITHLKKTIIIPDQWTANDTPELVDSELAHRVPGWLVFPHNKALKILERSEGHAQ
jgi:hypothetical protein